MKLSIHKIALAATALTLAGALLLTSCGNDQQPSDNAGGQNDHTTGAPEQDQTDASKEDQASNGAENVVFAITNTPMDQSTYGEDVWICALFRVTNLSQQDIVLDDFLTWDEFMTKAYDYGDSLEDLYRDQSALCRSVVVRSASGEIPCIMALENGVVSKTLPAGQSVEVWLTTLAPEKNRVLNVLYQGVHQTYLYYGKGTGPSESASTASSTVPSSAAASEVGAESFVTASEAAVDSSAAASTVTGTEDQASR